MKPDTATPDEYSSIQRFLEEAYGVTRDFFPARYPSWWGPDTTDFSRICVIRGQHGEILSLVRVFPLDLQLGPARLTAGGIGAVATAPSARGRGLMSRVMEFAIARMKEEGFPLSILWGDRHRYSQFGYENGGRALRLSIGLKGLQRSGIRTLEPVRCRGEEAELENMAAAYARHPFRRRRGAQESRLIYSRRDLLLHCAGEGATFGYLILLGNRARGGVAEFGGDPETVLGLAAGCCQRYGLSELSFPFPDWENVAEPYRRAANGATGRSAAMLKVLDTGAVLAALNPQCPDRKPPGARQLDAWPETRRVEALFGTFSEAPFNVFCWPLDQI